MKTVIVYDSHYGNTEQIARAMAERLGKDGRARLLAADAASERDLAGSDLVVVGGPTQMRGISPALRTFLDGLPPNVVQGVPAAAFDLRMPGPRVLTGSAATGIARRLARKGAQLVVPPESFIARGMKGPLAEGELARAGSWAATVQARARGAAARPNPLRAAAVVIGPSLALVFLSAASATAAVGWLTRPSRSKGARRLRLLSAPGVVWTVAYPLVIRPWHLHWGATAEEVRRSLPGDEVVPQPGWQSTRAITIHAPARAVWRWLVQVGQGRGGFYTYDWLENLAGLDIHSANRIVPELQRLKVGDFVRSAPELAGPAFGWTVARIEPERALVLGVGRPGAGDAGYPGVWTFVLDAIDARTTRLIVRGRMANKPAVVAGTVFIELQWFIMERGMLQGIKRRAERAP